MQMLKCLLMIALVLVNGKSLKLNNKVHLEAQQEEIHSEEECQEEDAEAGRMEIHRMVAEAADLIPVGPRRMVRADQAVAASELPALVADSLLRHVRAPRRGKAPAGCVDRALLCSAWSALREARAERQKIAGCTF